MVAATEVAKSKTPARAPFIYADITSKWVLPLWWPPDAVGGRSQLSGDYDLMPDSGASSSTLTALTQALKVASPQPRFFRNMQQWLAAFLKYAAAAVATEQVTWTFILTHLGTVLKLAEDEKLNQGPFLAILYDDLARRTWAHRALRRDPDLDK